MIVDCQLKTEPDRVASFLTEDCVYEDLLLGPSTVCRGRDAFVNALRFHPAFVSNKLLKDSPALEVQGMGSEAMAALFARFLTGQPEPRPS